MIRKMPPLSAETMRNGRPWTRLAGATLALILSAPDVLPPPPAHAQDDLTAFAVISETPNNKARVQAKVLIEGALSDTALIPSDTVMTNPIWRTIEICHAMKLQGTKTTEGFRIQSVHILDASMLPMALQGFAGDCLIKKAVEIAPLVD